MVELEYFEEEKQLMHTFVLDYSDINMSTTFAHLFLAFIIDSLLKAKYSPEFIFRRVLDASYLDTVTFRLWRDKLSSYDNIGDGIDPTKK